MAASNLGGSVMEPRDDVIVRREARDGLLAAEFDEGHELGSFASVERIERVRVVGCFAPHAQRERQRSQEAVEFGARQQVDAVMHLIESALDDRAGGAGHRMPVGLLRRQTHDGIGGAQGLVVFEALHSLEKQVEIELRGAFAAVTGFEVAGLLPPVGGQVDHDAMRVGEVRGIGGFHHGVAEQIVAHCVGALGGRDDDAVRQEFEESGLHPRRRERAGANDTAHI